MQSLIRTVLLPLFIVTLAGCLLSSCSYSSKASQALFDKAKTQVYDVIVVPGIPLENGTWSRVMKGRVIWAKYLYDQGIAKNIIFSGAAVSSPYNEAVVMGLYAMALNVPKEHVFAEKTAEHSTENIYYSYHMASQLGFKKVALASDPFQTKLLRKFTRKRVSPAVDMIPFVIDTLKTIDDLPDPSIDITQAFEKDFVPLKKKYGFFKRLKGTLGYDIKKIEQ
ncbi:MAG: YdcF family protein [Bacteroidota bacterium]